MKNLQLTEAEKRILAKITALHASAQEKTDVSKKVDLFIQFGAYCSMLNADPFAILTELNQQYEQSKAGSSQPV